ncbi:putative serine incorporator [Senna tora]|uniref:Putative serine incorporator n=1 Tax=Senna tora TaxID=362788 RepID=A0A834T1I4_9FABA|nr:putative serine incorporator [Senna tora]
MAFPFLFPSELVQIYGEIARIGAGIKGGNGLLSRLRHLTNVGVARTNDSQKRQHYGSLVEASTT